MRSSRGSPAFPPSPCAITAGLVGNCNSTPPPSSNEEPLPTWGVSEGQAEPGLLSPLSIIGEASLHCPIPSSAVSETS